MDTKQTDAPNLPHERTYRDEVVAWRLIDAECPAVAGGVFDEGVDATIDGIRRWRLEGGVECHREADAILEILTRPVVKGE